MIFRLDLEAIILHKVKGKYRKIWYKEAIEKWGVTQNEKQKILEDFNYPSDIRTIKLNKIF